MAVERVLFQVNARTAMSVGQASGLALALAGRAGVPVVQYSPNEVKLAVAGDGGADKDEVQEMVTRLPAAGRACPHPPDAADALALALCHWWRAPLARRRRAPAAAPSPRSARRRDRGRGRQGGGHPMIGSVRGTVLERTRHRRGARRGRGRRATACWCPPARCRRSHPGAPAFLFTHLHVREDAMMLYGFPTRDERDTFEVLIGATGVGPKLALAMLSVHSPDGAAPRRARGRPRRAHARARRRQAHRAAAHGRAQGAPRRPRPRPRRARGTAPAAAGRGARRARGARVRARRGARRRSPSCPSDGAVEDLLRDALKLLAVTRVNARTRREA